MLRIGDRLARQPETKNLGTAMNTLAKLFTVKIAATMLFWCVPLILLPSSVIEAAGFPKQDTYMFVRMLGWAYLALCVGYGFGLKSALQGKRSLGPIWVGIVSNGGACAYLCYYGLVGTWSSWGGFVQFVAWTSVAATLLITIGLFAFGVMGRGEAV
jgi:hypothetical protein